MWDSVPDSARSDIAFQSGRTTSSSHADPFLFALLSPGGERTGASHLRALRAVGESRPRGHRGDLRSKLPGRQSVRRLPQPPAAPGRNDRRHPRGPRVDLSGGQRGDLVVATSPQFFCGWAGAWAARLRRVPFVLEIRDLWPESIGAVDAIRNRPLLRFLGFLEKRLYRSAAHIVTVGDGYQARILEKADVADRISVITNGVDLARFAARSPAAEFLNELGFAGKFTCSYVGTIGMAHGLEVVAEAARILRDRGREDIRFCLVGDGAVR